MEVTAALVWCPFPERDIARAVSRQLIGEKLAVCANIVADIESLFEWDGKINHTEEVAVLFKTSGERLDRLIARLGALHPYDAPAIVGWHCDSAHPATLEWIGDQLGKERQ